MTINGIAFTIGIILAAVIAFCSYWMGRNDEREMWERARRSGRNG